MNKENYESLRKQLDNGSLDIPSQITINKLLAMIIYSVMKTAFPTLIYDADRLPQPTNEIGKAIPNKDIGSEE